ncbi:MAG: hypothetical protein N4A71_19380 [Carboxylicivirga sp.]|jgi:hypothetical protein|nr:hypothetical protein [Carboxylicivirga sp.]
MKRIKVNSNTREELIDLYKARSLKEIQKIIPKWAYGKDSDKLLNIIQNPVNKEFSIYFVETNELISKTEFNEVCLKSLFTEESLNDGRIANLLLRWENNEFVDPPEIFVSSIYKNKLEISDGRHRTKLAYFLKCKKIPVAIHKSEISAVKKIVRLKNI